MSEPSHSTPTRRALLAGMAALPAAAALAPATARGQALPTAKWADQIGLELYTVRDLMETDFEGTLAKLAAIGYREIEPANGYNKMSPKAFRAMLGYLRAG